MRCIHPLLVWCLTFNQNSVSGLCIQPSLCLPSPYSSEQFKSEVDQLLSSESCMGLLQTEENCPLRSNPPTLSPWCPSNVKEQWKGSIKFNNVYLWPILSQGPTPRDVTFTEILKLSRGGGAHLFYPFLEKLKKKKSYISTFFFLFPIVSHFVTLGT